MHPLRDLEHYKVYEWPLKQRDFNFQIYEDHLGVHQFKFE